ncbi:hypothetical protein [Nitratireductor sp. ZSWI3]|uniref:hypothetical protein n=1 Tax=Nitratireductor sp. ZSWI3 TaxID=2966359 RepID=UPI00215004B6|nr:hypothetical protein [Nitratireductor sp. ZSWI3]MCR4267452.1 hypothetical protein [Nitratireductor sp. ZSWI3]
MTPLFSALGHLAKGLALAAVVASPLIAVQNVRAGHENIIEGHYEKSSGAGLVLMVSLKRAR